MQITLAKSAGFCFGVRRAVARIEAVLCQETSASVYTLGDPIHNRHYITSLRERGVVGITMEDTPRIAASATKEHPAYIFIRAHGIPMEHTETLAQLAKQNPSFHVEDVTCPFVKRIQDIAREETSEDTRFILLGHPNHAECVGIMSYAKGEAVVFPTSDEVISYLKAQKEVEKPLILVSQTTQNVPEWKKTKKYLKKLYTNPKIFDTICNVTDIRQHEAMTLAESSDCMIVIGGRDSSNTERLYELCRERCPDTRWIESIEDLTDPPRKGRVSITAGASTPDGIITEVYHTMSMEDYASLLDESLKTIHTGDIVVGTVQAVTDKCVYLDLGTKQTGVIEADKLCADPSVKPTQLYKVGDEIKAFVVHVDDKEGEVILDKLRVDRDAGWLRFVEEVKENPVKEGTVTAVVKGGITMDIDGYRVFVPASQTGVPKDGELSALVGTTQKVKVIEVDEGKKRVVASIKSYQFIERREARAARDAARDAIFATLEVGQKFHSTIKNITPYGAFVDLGGVDGMIHKSELSWKPIKNPAQVVSVGQEVDVYIKEIDHEHHRISLGYKTEEMDAFSNYIKDHKVGDIVSAKIVSIVPFGAFAEVAPDVDGLIHNSRISLERVDKPESVLSIGQVVEVQITGIDTNKRQLALSIRAILEAQRRAEEEAARAAERAERAAERAAEAEERERERAEMAPYIIGTID